MVCSSIGNSFPTIVNRTRQRNISTSADRISEKRIVAQNFLPHFYSFLICFFHTGIVNINQMFHRGKPDVLVIIGTGVMGTAVARRLGNGRHTCIGNTQGNAVSSNSSNGHAISHHSLHLPDHESVRRFAQEVSNIGRIDAIVVTAPGSSPLASTPRQIYEVDLLGIAHVIDAFLPYVSPRTSVVCIASTAANIATHFSPLSRELEKHLATAPIDQLLNHRELDINSHGPEAARRAYAISKRGNQLRVEGAAVAYGKMGARINSISPGTILVKMVKREEEEGSNRDDGLQGLIDRSVLGKAGTVEDVANVVAFLVSHESQYITGIDIVVDGGTFSGKKWET